MLFLGTKRYFISYLITVNKRFQEQTVFGGATLQRNIAVLFYYSITFEVPDV